MRRNALRFFWVFLLAGCGQDTAAPHNGGYNPPSPIVVSNATTNAPPLATTRNAASKRVASYSVSTSAATDEVTYVSLLPNSAPGGTSALVSDARTHVTVTAEMVDGGLDPVPIPASVGDTIRVDVFIGGTAGPHFDRVVPRKATPTVIRSIPARGKTGVPLNKSIVVVFSEPVSASSISSGAIALLRGGIQVAGTAQLLEGVTAAAVFNPTSPLAANTEYQLVVTNGVHDLDGDVLDSTVTIPFTTGTETEGPIANLVLLPSTARVHVGDQFQMFVTVTDAQGNVLTGKPITWYEEAGITADEGTVSVTNTGLVTANREGTGFVLAQVGTFLTSTMVIVSSAQTGVESVTLSPDTLTLAVKDTADVNVVTKDPDGTQLRFRVVQWSSTSTGIATVTAVANNRARIDGVAIGTAKVIATVEGVSDTTVVSVGPIPATAGLVLSNDDTLLLHETEQLTAMSRNAGGGRAPLNANDVQWESSNTGVVTVDASGIAIGVGAGLATITARWNGFTATVKRLVIEVAFQSVTASHLNTCGLTTNGSAYCWGAAAFGQTGRPGLDDVPLAAAGIVYYPWPVPTGTPLDLTELTAGGYHTCGVTTRSVAYCWGLNDNGELGNGTIDATWRATPVLGGLTFTEVRAGTNHTCAVTTVGNAYCWGSNSHGELGSTIGASSTTPVAVQGAYVFKTLTLGDSHSCGLTANGAAYCWGNNAAGQLGAGDNVTTSATPLPVVGGLIFASLSAGASHTCGITSNGALYCWGWNLEGELGNGDAPTPSSTPILVAPGHLFLAVSAGANHTCAIDTAHDLYCWGLNGNGQLGLGTGAANMFITPQRVPSTLAFAKLSLGVAHSCAATTADVWYCWGKNDSGQLGTGNTVDSPVPLKILGQR